MKDIVLNRLTLSRDAKIAELEQLVGIVPEKRKPAVLNPEFEAAVNDMVEQSVEESKPTAKPIMTVEEVRRMYHDENKQQQEIAKYFGVSKSVMNNFIADNHLGRTSYKKNDIFLDSKVEAKRKGKP